MMSLPLRFKRSSTITSRRSIPESLSLFPHRNRIQTAHPCTQHLFDTGMESAAKFRPLETSRRGRPCRLISPSYFPTRGLFMARSSGRVALRGYARIFPSFERLLLQEIALKISREDVLRVAELAYLDLSEGELERYRAQIDEILEYIGKLNELDTAKVEPMAQVLSDDQTVDATLREDLIVPCAVAEDVLKHAPDPEPPYFRVPKVIGR